MVWEETGIKRKVIEEIILLAKEHGALLDRILKQYTG